MTELRTDRLLIRPWRDTDLAPWAAMNADPEVREHLGDVLTREQSDASVARFQAESAARGYGWLAVGVRATGEFVGFAGLDDVDEGLPFTGVEIGWRLARGPGATATRRRRPAPSSPTASAPSASTRSSPSPPRPTSAPRPSCAASG